MVPYVYVDDMDDIAEEFLKKYYPEALDKMEAIDPLVVVDRMKLKLKEMCIRDRKQIVCWCQISLPKTKN